MLAKSVFREFIKRQNAKRLQPIERGKRGRQSRHCASLGNAGRGLKNEMKNNTYKIQFKTGFQEVNAQTIKGAIALGQAKENTFDWPIEIWIFDEKDESWKSLGRVQN